MKKYQAIGSVLYIVGAITFLLIFGLTDPKDSGLIVRIIGITSAIMMVTGMLMVFPLLMERFEKSLDKLVKKFPFLK